MHYELIFKNSLKTDTQFMIGLFQDDVLSFFGNHKTIVDVCVR